MNSVNDLISTGQNSTTSKPQTISLNALRGDENQDSAININGINGLSGVSEQQESQRPVIKVNPNGKRPRRTITPSTEPTRINPDDYVQRPVVDQQSMMKTIQGNAISQLDETVRRKQQEYIDFINAATEADELNREKIESGIEEVNGEVNYLPEDLPQSITKDPGTSKKEEVNVTPVSEEDKVRVASADEYFDDVEQDLEDIISDKATVSSDIDTSAAVNSNPFASIDEDEEFADLDEEDEEVVEPAPVQTKVEEEKPVENTIIEEPKQEVKPAPAKAPEPEKKPVEKDYSITDTLTKNSISISSNIDLTGSTSSVDNSTSNDFNLDDEDFEDVTFSGDNEEQLTDDEIRNIIAESEKHLKNEILKKVINTGKTLDTSTFVVSNKVISIKDALKNQPAKEERCGYWPMMFAGRPFKATPLKGPEIALLAENDDSERDNGVGITPQQIRIMYEHDGNEFKPKTIEAWAKTIPFYDIESIFGAIYEASLKGANFIPMACPKTSCQYSYLYEVPDMRSLIKFENDDQKKKFDEILKTPITAENTGKYESVVNVINDRFAVGLKIPSIYTALYEYGSMNAEFARKYNSVLAVMQYIDYIYMVDPATSQFSPIGWKAYPGDYAKTFKSKIATYAKILKELDNTDFSVLIALINSMVNKMNESKTLTYEIPAAKCPKCGADIEARTINPRNMVFMRQRLVQLATSPTER